jgi:hypothetical protein
MYRKLPEFKKYTPTEVIFVTGLSAVIFLVGCIFVGHGANITEKVVRLADLRWFPYVTLIFAKFLPVELISNFLGGDYLQAVYVGWIIGVICIVAGLLGFSSVIRWAIFKLLKRRRWD